MAPNTGPWWEKVENRRVARLEDIEKDEFGRFIDDRDWVLHITFDQLKDEVEYPVALRVLYGPAFHGPVFSVHFKNIVKGTYFASIHHNDKNNPKKRADFISGCPAHPHAPMLAFCQALKKWTSKVNPEVTVEGPCGNGFTTDSDGCTDHKKVFGLDRNQVFVKMKNQEPVRLEDILLPWEIEGIERRHEEDTAAERRAIENAEIEEEALKAFDDDKILPHETYNKRKAKTYKTEETTPAPAPTPSPAELRRIKLEEKAKARSLGYDTRKDAKSRGKKEKVEEPIGRKKPRHKKKKEGEETEAQEAGENQEAGEVQPQGPAGN